MPLPLWAAPAIGAAGNILGSMFGNSQNRRNTRMQNQHEIRMWNLNNEYNTPLNQRARMEAAGFNPNIMYGSGSVANTAQQPKSAPYRDVQMPDMATPITQYLNAQVQNQQITNQQKALEVMDADIQQKQMATAGQAVKNAKGEVDLKLANTLFQNTVDGAIAKTKGQELRNAQSAIFNSNLDKTMKTRITESMARIENLKTTNDNLRIDTELKQLERDLRNNGMSWSDPLILRWLQSITGGFDFFDKSGNFINPFNFKP